MTDNVQKKTEELYCFLWFKSNRRRKSIFSSMECPCDSGLLRFDPRYEVNRFDNENRLLCYASLLTGDNVVRSFFLTSSDFFKASIHNYSLLFYFMRKRFTLR